MRAPFHELEPEPSSSRARAVPSDRLVEKLRGRGRQRGTFQGRVRNPQTDLAKAQGQPARDTSGACLPHAVA